MIGEHKGEYTYLINGYKEGVQNQNFLTKCTQEVISYINVTYTVYTTWIDRYKYHTKNYARYNESFISFK